MYRAIEATRVKIEEVADRRELFLGAGGELGEKSSQFYQGVLRALSWRLGISTSPLSGLPGNAFNEANRKERVRLLDIVERSVPLPEGMTEDYACGAWRGLKWVFAEEDDESMIDPVDFV